MSFNYSLVTTRLATGGGNIVAADIDALKADGITAVIDCQTALDDSVALSQMGIVYLFNGVEDDGQPKPVSWFQKSIEFALPLLARPNQKIYAHCAAGRNRGPSTALAIMLALGWCDVAAIAIINIVRPLTLVGGICYRADALAAVKALGYC